jgi:hypothetical protein
MQQAGSFNSSQIETIKTPYCNAGATVYEVTSYVDGLAQLPSVYQNETGDILTLTAAQIAALTPGECDREYDEEGEFVCAAGVTLRRIEIFNNSTGTVPTGIPIIVWVNATTNAVVAAPATFTWGVCSAIKPPITARVYGAVGAVTVPATSRREVFATNRSNRDLLVTWTSSVVGGGGNFTLPARGTYTLSLTEDPAEGVITGMTVALDAFGVGAITANSLLFNFKN